LEKILWPHDLAVFYPYELSLPLWEIILSGAIIIIITLSVLYYIRKQPFLFVGWFWYLGTLIPVIGLVQVGSQVMADRYTYLPSIGIAIMLAWCVPFFIKNEDKCKNVLFPLAAAFLVILSVLTWQQCGYWKSNTELWTHNLKITRNNWLAHNNIACHLKHEGKINEALYHYNEAIRINPYYADAYNNRGVVYYNRGQYQHAIEDYSKAIRIKPNYTNAYFNRGVVYGGLGQYQLSIEDFNEVIRLEPNYAEAYNNRGFTYFKIGQYQRAIVDYNSAITHNPGYADAYCNRAVIYLIRGNKELGCSDAQKAHDLGNCKTLEAARDRGYCQ